jgi:lysophospholipase L1-like esterase
MTDRAPWTRYVAIGDSFTEGMEDPRGDGTYRGWADRLADVLAAGRPGEVGYANLAVRGRLLGQIVGEQVPAAIALEPDLVSIVGGGNDVLRPGADVDVLAARLEQAVVDLRAAGADVLLATPVDPGTPPLINRTRGKAATFGMAIWSIGRRHGCHVLDLWGMRALRDRRMWAPDRIHLTPEGHARVAAYAAQVLGLSEDGSWAQPLDPEPARRRSEVLREDAEWVRRYVGPWVGRRLRGRSSGDLVQPKRPEPLPLDPPSS